jgi:hypothetical protein
VISWRKESPLLEQLWSMSMSMPCHGHTCAVLPGKGLCRTAKGIMHVCDDYPYLYAPHPAQDLVVALLRALPMLMNVIVLTAFYMAVGGARTAFSGGSLHCSRWCRAFPALVPGMWELST